MYIMNHSAALSGLVAYASSSSMYSLHGSDDRKCNHVEVKIPCLTCSLIEEALAAAMSAAKCKRLVLSTSLRDYLSKVDAL